MLCYKTQQFWSSGKRTFRESEQGETAPSPAKNLQIVLLRGLRKKPRLQGGAPKIAKLDYNSNNYGLWHL